MQHRQTIVAPGTAHGRSALAVIRVSGPDCTVLIEKHFRNKNEKSILKPGKLIRGVFVDGPQEVDEIMLCKFENPRSYTGEDLFEVHCHGNPMIVREIIAALKVSGCRMAEPGEFTKRAFLNGKMDLIQAEAVALTIESQTRIMLDSIRNQMSGSFSQRIEKLRNELVEILAWIEADIDFGDREVDDVVPVEKQNVFQKISKLKQRAVSFSHSFQRSQMMRDGFQVVLTGRANVGKSSLFNFLSGSDRALVDSKPGTTRDYLETSLSLEGIPCKFIDTAGFHCKGDALEQKGMLRARECIQKANLVLAVFDQSELLYEDDKELLQFLRDQKNLVFIFNKCDLPKRLYIEKIFREISSNQKESVTVSAKTGEGMDEFLNVITKKINAVLSVEGNATDFQEKLLFTERQAGLLQELLAALDHAKQTLEEGFSEECLTFDLRNAVNALSRVLGRELSEDNQTLEMDEVLDGVFSQFCIGK